MSNLIRVTSAERGVALPAAMMTLIVSLSLTAVVAGTAMTATHQSQRERNTKAALAAVDAGIGVAIHRLNTVDPDADECALQGPPPQKGPPDPTTPGWCPFQVENLGDDELFLTRTSIGTVTGGSCQTRFWIESICSA